MPAFAGKAVIITGSSNGIGRATALLFAKKGASVTITGRNADRLEETRQQLLKATISPDNINVVQGDLTTSQGQDKLIQSTIERFGKIDILINCAGANIPDPTGKTGTDQSMDSFHKNIQLNLQGVVEMVQKVKPHLMKTRGEIINVSTVGAEPHAQPDFIYYSIAKAALNQYTRSIAIDLIKHGIRVNSVSPGITDTGFGTAMGMSQELSKKVGEYMASHRDCIPCGYVAQPKDIAVIICFLADRKQSHYIIGQSIIADGGGSLMMGVHSHDLGKMMKSFT